MNQFAKYGQVPGTVCHLQGPDQGTLGTLEGHVQLRGEVQGRVSNGQVPVSQFSVMLG